MQIHELNTFSGTLGAGAYLAIDDGTDTGKISSQGLLAATEARIDNIIAGPAPSAEEIVDARLGADGVTYPSLGDAIRDQVTDLKSDLAFAPVDLLIKAGRNDKTDAGITFTWNADKTACTVNGTVSGSIPAAQYFNGSTTAIPNGFKAGKTYNITLKSTSQNAGIGVYYYKNNGTYYAAALFRTDTTFTIPSDATGMRIFVFVMNGTTVSNDVVSDFGIFECATNEQISERTEQLFSGTQKSLEDGSYLLHFERKEVTNQQEQRFATSQNGLSTDFRYFDNKFLKIVIDSGYRAKVYFRDQNDNYIYRSLNAGRHFFYAGSSVPVAFTLFKNPIAIITADEAKHITITDVNAEEVKDIGCGIKEHNIEWDNESGISSGYLYFYNSTGKNCSCPIKIPKSGLRIGFNPKYHTSEYIYPTDPDATPLVINYKLPPYRFMVVKKGDDGLVVSDDDENLEAITNSGTYDRDSVYIPYIEDCYVIIVVSTTNALPDRDYTDLLIVSSGEVDRGYCGVYNIQPTGLHINLRSNNSLDIHGYEDIGYSLSSQMYYCTIVRLREAKKIVCSPKYTLLAEIYKINDDRTVIRYTDVYGIWSYESTTGQHTTSGVPVIDLEQYDFDGFALVAIQSKVTVIKSSNASGYAFKRWTTGLLGGYEDVRRSICVDYYNDVNISYVPGMPSIMEENIHKLCNWKIPEYGSGNYVEQGYTSIHRFDTMYDVVPGMYNGTFLANSYLMQVTAKSLMTCVKNRNGRMRKMQRVEENQPGTDGVATLGNIGYGLTCTNFTSVIRGLVENYSSCAMAFGDNAKFDRYDFDYHDLSNLRPGDILTKHYPEVLVSRTSDSHCMTVSSIVTVNGVVRAINIIEGYAPYNRFTTYIDEAYYDLSDEGIPNWITDTYSFKHLERFKWINRIKPQYLKPIEETFEMYPNNTDVGTVMCDRGTDSIYGEHTQYVELSFKDSDVTTNLYLYKSGTQIATIPKSGAYTVNGLKLLNIASYLDGEGLYTVKTDQSDDVQETFYVKGDVEAMTCVDGLPEYGDYDPTELTPEEQERNYTDLSLTSIDGLEWLEIRYGKNYIDGKRSPFVKTFTFLKDQFVYDGEKWTIRVPQFMPKIFPDFVPPSSDYPDEPNWSSIESIYRVYKTPYGTYHATRLGHVSSDYYGLD